MLPVWIDRHRGGLAWPNTWDMVDNLQRDFGRFVGRVFGDGWEGEAVGCPVNVREDDNHYFVEAEVPGLSKEDLDITLENGVLTITGEKKFAAPPEESRGFHIRERRYGRFTRQFTLPTAVNEDQVQASMKDGVLTITLDKREEVKPKKISVNLG